MQPIFRAQNAVLSKVSQPFTFEINNKARTAIFGPLKWDLLEMIGGKIADPRKRISFPGIGHDLWPSQAIQLTKFGQSTSSSAQAPFVGARYESFRDEFDVSLKTVLESKAPQNTPPERIYEVADKLDLVRLLDNWYLGLSNGQSRRAQLASALLRQPRLLVMDEPFLGLDPTNRTKFSDILSQLPIPVVIGLRGGEVVPKWVTQLLYVDTDGVMEGEHARFKIQECNKDNAKIQEKRQLSMKARKPIRYDQKAIEMRNVTIKYPNAESPLFENLNLIVHAGERVHIKGPNGSGKSTLLALVTADHPHVWSSDISLFGEKLRVGKHSYFTINKLIGYTSPELHAIFPKRFTARRVISTGFTGNMCPPQQLSNSEERLLHRTVQRLGIDISDETPFGDMPLGQQKLVLFARALVKQPKMLILDEAFSTLDRNQMELAFQALDEFDGAVLVVGHVEEEIPICDKTLELS